MVLAATVLFAYASLQSATPVAGPYTAELIQICQEDQADRQFGSSPTKEQAAILDRNDPKRLARVKEILRLAPELSGDDLDRISLIFQHGRTPLDFAIGHFVALCCNKAQKINSLPALTEDRFLESVGRRQRFGSQFSETAQHPVDEARPTAVTDFIRACYMVPSLTAYKSKGWRAGMDVANLIDLIVARRHLDHSPATPTNGKSVRHLSARQVLDLYNRGELKDDEQMADAARTLLHTRQVSNLLLAHELATLCYMETGQEGPLVRKTWEALCRNLRRQAESRPWVQFRTIAAMLK